MVPLGALPGLLAAQLLGPEFAVTTYTTYRQASPKVAGNGLGDFVVVWSSQGQDGSGYGVFGQRFDSAATPQGIEFQVNTFTTDDQRRPAVAADATGSFVVVWASSGQDGSSHGVFGQRFDAQGNPQGSEFPVNTHTTGTQHYPAVAKSGSGEFVVVWASQFQDGSSLGIFGQRFNQAGSPLGGEFQVNSYWTNDQWYPAVAVSDGGSFVVVWQSLGEDAPGFGVFGQAFNSAGATIGNQFQVNTYTTSFQRDPAIATDAAGDFIVVWTSQNQDGSGQGVFGQRLSSTGGPLGSEFPVNRLAGNDQAAPAVAADASGDFVVTWADQGHNGFYQSISAQRFNALGSKAGGQFRVDGPTTDNRRNPAITASGAGEFVTAWMSFAWDASEWDVLGQRLAPPLFADGFEAEDVCGWSFVLGSGDICP